MAWWEDTTGQHYYLTTFRRLITFNYWLFSEFSSPPVVGAIEDENGFLAPCGSPDGIGGGEGYYPHPSLLPSREKGLIFKAGQVGQFKMPETVGPVQVRTAVRSDLDKIVEFNAAMARETEDKELDRFKVRAGVAAVLQDQELGFYLIAEVDGQVAGQLLITSEWSDWRNGFFWWIQSVYVAPNYRRRGVYRALDAQVRAEALKRGDVCGVRLYVERNNHVAQGVYRSVGMSQSHYDMYEIEFRA